MNIQSEKLNLIQWLTTLNDVNIINRIKTLQSEYQDISQSEDEILKEKLTSRAIKANEDIKAGRTYNRQEAEAYLADKMKAWK